ncbi:class I SAM-dependent methyltransferase [Prosthecobacter sp.]|uniref:class I SAM-dependent methyltransferase n=1 Tax=Prosthecobacter sp. TaxID=1965333 RepID=UPI001D2EA330|nr:class I SAM-dependent methyltransferase [Prosthecobacter sp.]MCB1277471.1 methyltransferase domain-containing protein [Prosthecobacter sp.]
MTMPLSAAILKRIAFLCPKRWDRCYTLMKLATDPVYAAVGKELGGSTLPVLDVGCGIGLLAFYLRESGFTQDISGFDYDEKKISSARAMAVSGGYEGLSFMAGDARSGLPEFSGHVVILDILQFFKREEQAALLKAAAARVAEGGRLIIRTGLQDDSTRFHVTVIGDWVARLTLWMKEAPVCYPDGELFRSVLGNAGLKVCVKPLWGGTPFNNHLVVAER